MEINDILRFAPAAIVLIGITTFLYNFYQNSKKPKIEIYPDIPSPELNSPETPLDFDERNMSNEFLLNLSIYNLGNKRAESILFGALFHKEVEIIENPKSFDWIETDKIPNYRGFKFSTDARIWPKNTNKKIGEFKLKYHLNQIGKSTISSMDTLKEILKESVYSFLIIIKINNYMQDTIRVKILMKEIKFGIIKLENNKISA